MQASWERRSRGRLPLPGPTSSPKLPLFSLSLFLSLSISAFGSDLGISVGVLTLPEVVWNRNLGFSRPTATRPSLPIFHGEAGKPGKHPSPHRSTSPLPCVGCPRGSENIPVSRHLHQIRVRRRQELVAALGGLTRPPSVARPSCPRRPPPSPPGRCFCGGFRKWVVARCGAPYTSHHNP